MAIYVPPSRRKVRRILVGAALLIVGALIGFLVARATTPSLDEQVSSAQAQGRQLAAGLRVIALHEEAQAASGERSTDFALRRTQTGLTEALAVAPWIPSATRVRLTADVADLRGSAEQPDFAERVEAVAAAIEAAFGIAPQPAASP